MWSRTFADVLDDALGVTPGPAMTSSRGASTPTLQPVHPFLFFTLPAAAGTRGTYAPAPWKHTRNQAVAVEAEPAEVRQPARTLTAGQQYYLQALHKEGSGGDHLAIAWTTPTPGSDAWILYIMMTLVRGFALGPGCLLGTE